MCVDSNVIDGTACGDDMISCASFACLNGSCEASIDDGACLIDGECYVQGAFDPGTDCQQCRTGTSKTMWSTAAPGTACGGSTLSCVTAACDDQGMCSSSLNAGTCLIDSVCYSSGERNPSVECEWCDPSVSTNTWSVAVGQQCTSDGLSCTTQSCDAAGSCVSTVNAGRCLIAGTCFSDQERNPSGACEWCDAAVNADGWTIAEGQPCSDDDVSCTVDVCDSAGDCTHRVAIDKCLINTICYESGENSPINCCMSCLPNVSQDQFSPSNEGMTCSSDCGGVQGQCEQGACTNGVVGCISDLCP